MIIENKQRQYFICFYELKKGNFSKTHDQIICVREKFSIDELHLIFMIHAGISESWGRT